MDLNLSRRKREMAIAQEVAAELLGTVSMVEAGQPDVIAHHFAVVCERLGVTLDNASVGRVMGYTVSRIVRKQRQVENLKREMDRVSSAFERARL